MMAMMLAQTEPWHGDLVRWTVQGAMIVIVASMFLCIYRLLRGPHLADRALAVDTLAIELIGLVILLSIHLRTVWYVDGVLVLSLLGFAGTVAMAHYIARPHLASPGHPRDSEPPTGA